MLLYRYLNAIHGLEALHTGRLKVGRLTELNDPHDCAPHISSEVHQLPANMAEVSQELVRMMSESIGVLCFSEVIDDAVLWSHYADGHRGLALGFDFSTDDVPPTKVEYTDKRPTIVIEQLRAIRAVPGMTDTPESDRIMKGYSTKAPSWSYEREYRSLIGLEKCSISGIHYFNDFHPDALRQVVLGTRCTISFQDIRRVLARGFLEGGPSYSQGIEIMRCKSSPSSFKFEFDHLFSDVSTKVK